MGVRGDRTGAVACERELSRVGDALRIGWVRALCGRGQGDHIGAALVVGGSDFLHGRVLEATSSGQWERPNREARTPPPPAVAWRAHPVTTTSTGVGTLV